jgi:hypothetical protein
VQAINTALLMKLLEQPTGQGAMLWTARPETASRLRGSLESILDWAKARGYRDGENPARWRGQCLASTCAKAPTIVESRVK